MTKDNNLIKEKESKTDIAYRIMLKKKKERSFYDLWNDVKAEIAKTIDPSEFDEEKIDEDISFFYTNLTMDGRFVNVGDNKWNLRERVTFDKVHIDMNEIYAEEDSDVDDDEDEEEYVQPDDYDESYDDSTSSDADINQYRDKKVSSDDSDDAEDL